MKRTQKNHSAAAIVRWGGVLAAGFLIIAGCSAGGDPVGPVDGDETGQRTIDSSLGGGGGLIPPPGGIGVVAYEHTLLYVFADRGGTLTSSLWTLEVPASALNRNKVVGLWSYARMSPGLPENLGVECEFTPQGIRFGVPATLSYNYVAAGIVAVDPKLLRIYRLDSEVGAWVECPTSVDDIRGNVSAPVSGDSRYALGLVRGGI